LSLIHTVPPPVTITVAGKGLTVTVIVTKQPVGMVYEMTEVPTDTPVTSPEELIVATAGVELLHVPPAVTSLSVVVDPWQTEEVPAIAAGKGLTVTVLVIKQPVGIVYEITDVPPDIPVTTPEELIVATASVALLQVPPGVASLSVVVDPAQTVDVPVIAAGKGLIVICIAGEISTQPLDVTVLRYHVVAVKAPGE
jgi:hypothetical protein